MNKKLIDKSSTYRKFKLFIIFVIIIFNTSKTIALENKILLKVDNQIITTIDILNEIKYLNLLNEEFKNFEKRKIYEIAKNSIIKETIRRNELEKYYEKIDLDEKFIKKFVLDYFKNFDLNSIDDLEKLLKEYDLKLGDLERKISIQLMWNNLIVKKFSQNVKINKQEIRDEMSKKKFQDEYLISEIVFNIKNKNELNQKYNDIKKEVKKNSFAKAAIIYSQSDTSNTGGKVGWIKEGSLSKNIKNELKKIKIGEITNPIQIPGAFIILMKEEKREISLNLDLNKEMDIIVKRKTNEQLNQLSNIYFSKIKKNVKINEL